MDDAESGLASGRYAARLGAAVQAVCAEAPTMTTNAAKKTGAEAPVATLAIRITSLPARPSSCRYPECTGSTGRP